MRGEGSLEAPTRHVIAWEDPSFDDRQKTEAEMRRVFDICHGCRRCFNLCDSFPRLFDLIDNSDTGELDGVAVGDYAKIAEACTLCDMCFMTKCPYVPPHEFNVDFPHLMLRYRAVEFKEGKVPWARQALGSTDRNGEVAKYVAPLANWGSDRHNKLTRPAMEKVAGVDRDNWHIWLEPDGQSMRVGLCPMAGTDTFQLTTPHVDTPLEERLRVLDATAFGLCMDNKLPMIVFGMEGEGNVARAVRGERIGTLVTAG